MKRNIEQLVAALANVRRRKVDIKSQLHDILDFESALAKRMNDKLTCATDKAGILLTQENIEARIRFLAEQIASSGIGNPILISVMDGALPFASALQQHLIKLGYQFRYQTIQVSSYEGTKSGKLSITSSLKIPVAEENVLVVDDVADTAQTYDALRKRLFELGARSVKLAVLVDKVQQRASEASHPTFAGFAVSKDSFIAGWGMDYRGQLRNRMLDIGVVDPSTLPNDKELQLLNSKKPLNEQLCACIAEEKVINQELQALHQPVEKNSFYFNCLVGLAVAGAAITALGVLFVSTLATYTGVGLVATASVALMHNYGLFSGKAATHNVVKDECLTFQCPH